MSEMKRLEDSSTASSKGSQRYPTTPITYISRSWNRVRGVNVAGKHLKNNVKSIVQRMTVSSFFEQPSSTKSKIPEQKPSSSSSPSTPSPNSPVENLLSVWDSWSVDKSESSGHSPGSSESWSTHSSGDDSPYDDLYFMDKLRISSSLRQSYGSYFDTDDVSDTNDTDIQSYDSNPFFPDRTSSEYSEFQEEQRTTPSNASCSEPEKYHQFEFHWSKNIEYCSPWVTHRSKEIFNHVSGLFASRKREIAENGSGNNDPDLKPEAFRENDSKADDDDSVTYEIANKLCDALAKQNNRVSDSDNTQLKENVPGNEGIDWQTMKALECCLSKFMCIAAARPKQQDSPTVSEATMTPRLGEKITPHDNGQRQPTQRNSYGQKCDRCQCRRETDLQNQSWLDFNAGLQRNAVRLDFQIQLIGLQNTREDGNVDRDRWPSPECSDSDDSWNENAAAGRKNDRQYQFLDNPDETNESNRNYPYCDEERNYSAGNEHSARPMSSDVDNQRLYDDNVYCRSSSEECVSCRSSHTDPMHICSTDKRLLKRDVLKLKPGKHVTIPLSWFNQCSAKYIVLELADKNENHYDEWTNYHESSETTRENGSTGSSEGLRRYPTTPVTYTSRSWNRVRGVNVAGKHLKNNVKSIVQRMTVSSFFEQPSSTKSKISEQKPSSSSSPSTPPPNSPVENLLSVWDSRSVDESESPGHSRGPSESSSTHSSDDDSLYGDLYFKNKLRISSTLRQSYGSYFDTDDVSYTNDTDIQSYDYDPFFPDRTSSEYTESQEEQRTTASDASCNEPAKYHQFEHQFHWSKNIEHCSPWVTHRSRVIFNHVGGLFASRKREIAENGSGNNDPDLKPEAFRENDSKADDDDSVTYQIANKLCDTLAKQNNRVTSEDQRSSSEHLKWTRLYENLVNYGKL